jgi:hypothetical protein
MSNGGMGRSEQPEKIIMQLLVRLLTFEKKTFVSGTRLEIFKKINPFDTEAEQLIIDALITELNEKLGADLATAINYDRGGRQMTPGNDDKTIIVVGNSHANYLATALATEGFVVPVVETRTWRPNTMMVEEARSRPRGQDRILLQPGVHHLLVPGQCCLLQHPTCGT